MQRLPCCLQYGTHGGQPGLSGLPCFKPDMCSDRTARVTCCERSSAFGRLAVSMKTHTGFSCTEGQLVNSLACNCIWPDRDAICQSRFCSLVPQIAPRDRIVPACARHGSLAFLAFAVLVACSASRPTTGVPATGMAIRGTQMAGPKRQKRLKQTRQRGAVTEGAHVCWVRTK